MTEEPQAKDASSTNPHYKSSHKPHINSDDVTGYVTTFFYNLKHLEDFAKQAGVKLLFGNQGLAYQTVMLPNGADAFVGRHYLDGDFWTLQHVSFDANGLSTVVSHIQSLLDSAKDAPA
jgi:hypothetical protein